MVRGDRRDLRVDGNGMLTESISNINDNINSVILGKQVILNPLFGPEEEDPIGLNVEGRKRSIIGHESQITMDADNGLQKTSISVNENVSKNGQEVGSGLQAHLAL